MISKLSDYLGSSESFDIRYNDQYLTQKLRKISDKSTIVNNNLIQEESLYSEK